MKISFCTTCMGRLHHLKQTLPQNIADNLPRPGTDDPDVEFVVLDYNSRDGLREWMLGDPAMRDYIAHGIVRYAHHPDAERFRVAHAKNMAHRLATGDIVCNLDADNYTGPRFAALLTGRFKQQLKTIQHPSFALFKDLPKEQHGCYGRLTLPRDDFFRLGGYDEALFCDGYSGEDPDLIQRAFGIGLKSFPVVDMRYMQTIPHDDEARIRNMVDGAREKLIERAKPKTNWDKLPDRLHKIFGLTQVNRDGNFGAGRVMVGLTQTPQNIGPAPMHREYVPRGIGLAGSYKITKNPPSVLPLPAKAHTPDNLSAAPVPRSG